MKFQFAILTTEVIGLDDYNSTSLDRVFVNENRGTVALVFTDLAVVITLPNDLEDAS